MRKKLGRYIYGNRANEHMSVDELNALERYLEIWMYNIRSAKVIYRTSEILKRNIISDILKILSNRCR